MNNKGQALIEFVLILPIFLFLLLAIYDFGMIFNSKTSLENDSSDIITLYKSGKSLEEIELLYPDNKIIISNDAMYHQIFVERTVDINTPGLNLVFGDPYVISVKRFIPYE